MKGLRAASVARFADTLGYDEYCFIFSEGQL